MSTPDLFPVDYNAWRAEWLAWLAGARADGTLAPTSTRFAGLNLLADERLGTWQLPDGRTVELSEVTMPDLGNRHGDRRRFVGLTFGIGADAAGALVESFAELDRELGRAAG